MFSLFFSSSQARVTAVMLGLMLFTCSTNVSLKRMSLRQGRNIFTELITTPNCSGSQRSSYSFFSSASSLSTFFSVFVLQELLQSCFTRLWIKGSLNMSSLTSRTTFFISSYGIPYYPRKIERFCAVLGSKILNSFTFFFAGMVFFSSKASVLLNTYKYFDNCGYCKKEKEKRNNCWTRKK